MSEPSNAQRRVFATQQCRNPMCPNKHQLLGTPYERLRGYCLSCLAAAWPNTP